jgi:hypothetical protein
MGSRSVNHFFGSWLKLQRKLFYQVFRKVFSSGDMNKVKYNILKVRGFKKEE